MKHFILLTLAALPFPLGLASPLDTRQSTTTITFSDFSPKILLNPILVYKRLEFTGFQYNSNLNLPLLGVVPYSPPDFASNTFIGKAMGGLLPGFAIPKEGAISDLPASFDLVSFCFACAGPAANGIANPALACSVTIIGVTLANIAVSVTVRFQPSGGSSTEMMCVDPSTSQGASGPFKGLKGVRFGVNDGLTQGQLLNLFIDNIKVKYS